jgi:hypothetical protein
MRLAPPIVISVFREALNLTLSELDNFVIEQVTDMNKEEQVLCQ